MENAYPEDRVFMYLRVGAGSLNEQDSQKGAAHFLEHMMFNGTTHYSAGELIEHLQTLGMEFGRDVNAHTSYEETAYFINVPTGSELQINEGLKVLSDYAYGALLNEDDFEQERGVILAEKRSRDSVQQRMYKAGLDFSFKGTKIPDRWVIGDERSIRSMTVDDLRAYYQTWYRPDNMLLAVVGRVDQEAVARQINTYFGGTQAAGADNEGIDYGVLAGSDSFPEVLYYSDHESESVNLSLETIREQELLRDGVLKRTSELGVYVLNQMMRARLQQLQEQMESKLSTASYHSVTAFKRYKMNMLSTKAFPDEWQDSLQQLITVLLSVKKYGFTQEELERAKRSVLAGLQSTVQTEKTRRSQQLARSIVNSAAKDVVFMSPAQELEVYSPLLEKLSLHDINELFNIEWPLSGLKIKVMGRVDPEGEARVKDVFIRTVHQPIPQPAKAQAVVFPYLHPVEPADVEYLIAQLDDLDVQRVTFNNGLSVLLKKTDFKQSEINVSISFGRGSNKVMMPGLTMIAETAINQSGTATLSQSDLDGQLAQYSLGGRFAVDGQNSALVGTSTTDDFEPLLQLLYAKFYDPVVRRKAFENQKEKMLRMTRNMKTSPQGIFRAEGQRFLAGGDLRFGMADEAELQAVSYEQVVDWYQSEMENGLIDIAVVGDFESRVVIELFQKYFGGALVDKEPAMAVDGVRFPMGKNFNRSIASEVEKGLVVMAWPVKQKWNIETSRRLRVLEALLDEEVRAELREKLGAVYSPSVFSVYPRDFDEFGYLALYMVVDPEQADVLVDETQKIVEELLMRELNDELAQRVLNPIIKQNAEYRKTNDYWLFSVLAGASRQPDKLEFAKSLAEAYKMIDMGDVKNTAFDIFQHQPGVLKILATTM